MFEFFRENLGTIIVGANVLAIIALIVIKGIKDRKAGKSSCGCGCENCPGCAAKKQRNIKKQSS
ncbi:MAG: FeoB-associated Cys-rich membrane protein [Oscillospiraceae bacterium]|nr:FeoB-associated Cys-rich membrane protein [Oscillospiraceae bacterium]